MKSENPSPQMPYETREEVAESRFLDEKISDGSSTESQTDKALAPTGLSNPFWN